VAFQLVSLRDRQVLRDWTQQELAEFYRVESVLGAAGISVELDRGLSDEGDPWFVFCRPQNGDVIIHFARYDGVYVAASGALGQVLRGRNFRELVDAFVARQPLVVPSQNQSSGVILHPSVLLTALVATALYLLDHQTANAAPILLDVDLDGEGASPPQPENKFATLINLLVEPLRPYEQREALLTIGAIVAGMAAISFDAAKETPVLAPALETASVDAAADQVQADDERLAQNNQMPAARKMADAGGDVNLHAAQDDGAGAGQPKLVIAEVTADTAPERIDTAHAPRTVPVETIEKETNTVAIDGNVGSLSITLFRGTHPVESDAGRKDGAETKIGTPQAGQAADGTEQVATVHIPIEKAEILLQDSIAASLTKNFGAGSFLHLSFVEASTLPQITASELSKLVSTATVETPKAFAVAIDSQSGSSAFSSGSASAGSGLSDSMAVGNISAAEARAMEAISFFAKSNPDFKITQLGKDIILFDFEARPDNKIVYDVHSWALPDGSKITIIGALPDQMEA
jgi:hypothetical protein